MVVLEFLLLMRRPSNIITYSNSILKQICRTQKSWVIQMAQNISKCRMLALLGWFYRNSISNTYKRNVVYSWFTLGFWCRQVPKYLPSLCKKSNTWYLIYFPILCMLEIKIHSPSGLIWIFAGDFSTYVVEKWQ